MIVTQKVDADDPALGFFVAWIREFARSCEHVEVLARTVGPRDLPENVAVHSLGAERGVSRPLRWLAYGRHLLRLTEKADVVLIHMCPPYLAAGWPLFRLAGKPAVLWYAHGSVTPMLRLAEKLADLVLTPSEESFRLRSKKIRVVGHGVSVEVLGSHAPDLTCLRMLTVGRIAPVKGLHVIVEGLERFAATGPSRPWLLDIVGGVVRPEDRGYQERLERTVAEAGLAERIRFLGPVPPERLRELYASHDLFLHASETGSLDKVMLEAAAAGQVLLSSSDAAGFLPEDMRFRSGDPAGLATRLHLWERRIASGGWKPGELAERVRREHGLQGFIARVLAELEGLRR